MLDPPLPVHGFARLGSALLVLDFLHSGPLILLKGFAWPEPVLLVLEMVHTGPLPSLRGRAYPGLPLFVLDFQHLGSLSFLQSLSCFGSLIPLLGLARMGLVFSLSVTDITILGSSALARSLARLESFVSVPDFSHLDSLPSLHNYA